MGVFVIFLAVFCWNKGGKQPPHRIGSLPLVASHEKTELASSASCSGKKGRSRSDKRKKENGVVAGESEVQRFAVTQVSVRHLLPLRLYLLLEAADAACSGLAPESRDPQWSHSIS